MRNWNARDAQILDAAGYRPGTRPDRRFHENDKDKFDVMLLPRVLNGNIMHKELMDEMRQDAIGHEFSGDGLRKYNSPHLIVGKRYKCYETYMDDQGLRGKVLLLE